MVREELLTILMGLPADRKVEVRGDSAWMICPSRQHAGGFERARSYG